MSATIISSVILLKEEGDEVFVLTLTKTRIGGRENYLKKVPGGERKSRSETPKKTAIRELFEETGIFIPRTKYLRRVSISENETRDRSGAVFIKHFFMALWENAEGSLRVDDIEDGNVVLFPPQWTRISGLKDLDSIAFQHKEAVREAIRIRAQKSPVVAYVAANIFSNSFFS